MDGGVGGAQQCAVIAYRAFPSRAPVPAQQWVAHSGVIGSQRVAGGRWCTRAGIVGSKVRSGSAGRAGVRGPHRNISVDKVVAGWLGVNGQFCAAG